MATSVPDQPSFQTVSEKEVWQRLRRQLGDDCVLLANYRLSDKRKDHEADLVVLMPGSGIVVVEVKGSHVWAEPDGRWMIERYQQAKPIDPVGQARDAKYALRHYVETDPRWGSRPGPLGSSRGAGAHEPGRRLRHAGLSALGGVREG